MWEGRKDSKGVPICPVPNCYQVCDKFKNGKFRKYCDLHNGYSMLREIYWGYFKDRIFGSEGCCKCKSRENLEVDHIKAIMNGGEMWDENNLQILCKECHNKKTKEDFKERNNGR